MQKVFWTDPYLTELEAELVSVSGTNVRVDRSIFFAESGGQESDHGYFDNHPVIAACCDGADIVYQLPATHEFQRGQHITMRIDWTRRYRLMRLHFAAEVILELCYRRLPGIEKIGAHIGEHKARIDFRWSQTLSHVLPELSAGTHELIRSDQPITSAFSDEQKQRRYWQVTDFARVACSGTHLKSTGEVGGVRLQRKNLGRHKERLEITLLD